MGAGQGKGEIVSEVQTQGQLKQKPCKLENWALKGYLDRCKALSVLLQFRDKFEQGDLQVARAVAFLSPLLHITCRLVGAC
jgi:hypothetical protein